MPPVIGSILRFFPTWSETFVYRELEALRAQGLAVEVVAIRHRTLPALEAQSALGLSPGRPVLMDLPRFPLYLPILAASWRLFRQQPASVWAALGWGWRHLKLRDGLKALWMGDYFQRCGVELLHVHFAGEGAEIAEIIRQATGIPYVLTLHARDLFVPRPSVPELFVRARALICISAFNRAYLLQHFETAGAVDLARKVHVVRLGVPLGRWLEARPPPVDQFPLLAVSRLVEKKGLSTLFNALVLLRQRGVPATLTVVGEGSERSRLESQLRALQLTNVVTLLGKRTQQEIDGLYQAGVAAFVQPAQVAADGDMDGIPVALMEAMARRVPVVSCRVSGIPELIPSDAQGLLVAPNDPEALASALERLFRSPPLRRMLGDGGCQWVAEHFSLDENASQVAKLLMAMAGDSGFPKNPCP